MVKWAEPWKMFPADIAKPFREQAEGMALWPQNCSCPSTICPNLWAKHSNSVTFCTPVIISQLRKSSSFLLEEMHEKSSRHLKMTANAYSILKIHSTDKVCHTSYCLCAWGCELIISHPSIKLRSLVSLPEIQWNITYICHRCLLFRGKQAHYEERHAGHSCNPFGFS